MKDAKVGDFRKALVAMIISPTVPTREVCEVMEESVLDAS